jgi:hypothetical protein
MNPVTKRSRWSAARTVVAILGLAIIWVMMVARWWATDAVVPWDSKNHFYPMLRFLADGIHNGEIPLWNPFHFSGFPTVADPQSLLFTPTMLALAAIDPAPSLRSFDLVVFLHLLVGSLAIAGLFRLRDWHPVAALIAALVYAFGGAAAGRLQHTGIIISYALFPVALLFLEVALARRSVLAALGFAVSAAAMALGRDQVAFLFCFVLVAVAIFHVTSADRPGAYLRQRIGVLVIAGGAGLLLLIVPGLLTLQLLAMSNRPEIDVTEAMRGSLHWVNLAGLLAPDIFGAYTAPHGYWGPNWVTTNGTNVGDPSMSHVYVGLIPVAFVLVHGLGGGRAFARDIRFFTICGAAALLYAVGDATPIFRALYEWVPGVALYRRPADAFFVSTVMLAILAGYLVQRWIQEGPSPLRPLPLLLVGIGVAAMLVAAVIFAGRSERMPHALQQVALGLAALTTIAVLLALRWRRRAVVAGILLAITTADLGWRNAAAPFNAEPRSVYALLEQPAPTDERALAALETELAARHARGERPRVEIIGKTGAWLNAAMVYGLEDTVNYNPLRLDAYQNGVGSGENAGDYELRNYPAAFRGYRSTLARLLGIEYLVFDRRIEHLPAHIPRPQAELMFQARGIFVYRLPPAVPRAYLATRTRQVQSDESLAGDVPDFDPAFEALIDEATPTTLAHNGDRSAAAMSKVHIVDYTPNRVEITVDARQPGVLVLHDIFYPGWTVEVNGERQDMLRANLLFRGVDVTAGKNTVVFTFRPFALDNLIAAAQSLVGSSTEESAEPAVSSTPSSPPAIIPPFDTIAATHDSH